MRNEAEKLKEDQNGKIIIRDFRCCMCPAEDGKKVDVCECGFLNQYQDSRGWTYFVRTGLGLSTFKTFYRKPGKVPGIGEHGYRNTPWRDRFDQAQADLNKLAQEKGWTAKETLGKGVTVSDPQLAGIHRLLNGRHGS